MTVIQEGKKSDQERDHVHHLHNLAEKSHVATRIDRPHLNLNVREDLMCKLSKKKNLVEALAEPKNLRKAKVPPHVYTLYERSYLDIKRRYPRLYISQDFSKIVCHWTRTLPNSERLNIDVPVKVVCESEKVTKKEENGKEEVKKEESAPEEASELNGFKYNAKVVLICGVKPESSRSSSSHMSHLLKFLVAKKERSELLFLGGPWSAVKDGGDPTQDATLIQTAT